MSMAVEEWWAKEAADSWAKTSPKISAYGAHDLELMGEAMILMLGKDKEAGTGMARRSYGIELALWFYCLGKIARVMSGLTEGHDTTDSWFDISVYARMAMRTKETGQWP